MKLAVNTFMFKNYPIQQIEKIKDIIDIQGLGLFSQHGEQLESIQRKGGKTTALEIISYYVLFVKIDTIKDAMASLEEIKEKLLFISKYNIKSLTIIPQSHNDDWTENLKYLIREIEPICRSLDKRILIEPMDREHRFLCCISSLSDILMVNEFLNKDYFSWVVDLYYYNDLNELKTLLTFDNIYSIHLTNFKFIEGQKTRSSLLQGRLDMIEIIDLIKKNQYESWLELEVFNDEIWNNEQLKETIANIEHELKLLKLQ